MDRQRQRERGQERCHREYGALLFIDSQEVDTASATSAKDAYNKYISDMVKDGRFKPSGEPEEVAIGKSVALRADGTMNTSSGILKGTLEVILCDNKVYTAMFFIPEKDYEANKGDIDSALDSIKLDKPTAPVFSDSSETADKEGDKQKSDDQAADDRQTKEEKTEDANAVINIENNEEFAQLLNVADPGDPLVAEFAEKYKGRKIEFDAVVLSVMNHGSNKTRFDYMFGAGDDAGHPRGPNFKYEDINFYSFNWKGEEPDSVPAGTKLHCVAEIEDYKDNSQLFFLKPIETSLR